MKRIILLISMIFTIMSYSITYNNGNYFASMSDNSKIYEVNIMIRNEKIVSINFDVKNREGRSIIFGNKDYMTQKLHVQRELRDGVDIKELEIIDPTIKKNIEKLYYYLLNKINNKEQGKFVI